MTEEEMRAILSEELGNVGCPIAAARIKQGFAVFYPTDVAALHAMRRAYLLGRAERAMKPSADMERIA